jgi:PII interaction protein X
LVKENQELYTTLYAQRLFFLVTLETSHLSVEPIGRADARLLVENRLRKLRFTDSLNEYQQLQAVYKRTF